MPIYEYQCAKCGHEFERDQRITDEPVKKCPSCRSARVKRLISNTSFVLKGGGWYSDLYSSSGKAKPEGGDAGTGKDSGTDAAAKPASGGDEKPASGGDGKSTSGKPGGKAKPKKTAAA